MKIRLLFFLTFISALGLNAQIDSENKSIAIPAEKVEDPKEDNELIVKPEEKNEATPDEDNESVELPKTEELPIAKRKSFSIEKENKFKNPAELYQEQLKDALKLKEERERRYNGSTTTQYLGDFLTTSKRINIMYRDFSAPDGDLIKVYVNGNVLQSRVLLETYSKGFFLTLVPGDNILEFEALNQGTSGPNTAEFEVYDDKNNLLIKNQWNLATGVKATFTIIFQPKEE